MKVRNKHAWNIYAALTRLIHNVLLRGAVAGLAVMFFLASCTTAMEKQTTFVPAEDVSEKDLVNAQPSVDELCKYVLEKVEQNDIKSLEALAVSEDEVKRHIWPYSEWSRPERRMTFEFYWGDLHQKSIYALHKTMLNYGGKKFEYLNYRLAEDPMTYQDGKIYKDAWIQVRNDDGREGEIKIFGSVFELNGKYKIFSFVRK